MIINRTTLSSLYVAFHAAFRSGLGQAESQYERVATVVPSTTKSNEYGWLGKLPSLRKWVGDRVINGLETHGYAIKNEPFEITQGVDRDDIEDDNLGIYTPLFEEMGRATAAHPDELVFGLLKNGPSTLCFDGQNFFDTDHPVINEDGSTGTVSNWDGNGGSGTAWYLLDTSRALKPLILQNRKDPNFVAMDSDEHENVFMRKEYIYGIDCRRNVGFGFWQMAYGSRKELTAENVQAAYTAMASLKGDRGRPLGLRPNLLVVEPTQKFKAAEIVTARQIAGTDNIMKGVVEVIDVPWLL